MSDRDYTKLDRAMDRVKSKVFMGSASAFYAPLMSSLRSEWRVGYGTAGTNYESIFWDPDFFVEAPRKYGSDTFNEFVLQHELEHNARLHNVRRQDRNPEIWNWACDIRINNDLKLLGFNWGSFPAWYDPSFDTNGRMDEETIYDKLFQSGLQPPPSPWGAGGDMEGGDTTQSHQKSINNVVRATTNAKMEGKPGAIPGDLELMVEKFLAPVIPWEQELLQWHTELEDEEFTWARPNRRYTEMYLPSRFEDESRLAHLLYLQDVSGSVQEPTIFRFNSELKYVWERFRPLKMTIAQFTTVITKIDELEDGDAFTKMKVVGRGGTSLVPVRDLIIERKPTAAIIFSDMLVRPMEKLPFDIPVLWIVEGTRGHTPSFGRVIRIPKGGKGRLR